MTTLKGIFPNLKPVKGKNFIHENVKNLRRMKHFHMNKEEEIPKLQVHNWKKMISNNNNHNHNVLSKMTSNCRIKKHEGNGGMNSVINNKLDEQELRKKSDTLILNKSNVFIKEATNENSLFKQSKKQHKGLHKSMQKLQEKASEHPKLTYTFAEDGDNDTKIIKVKNQSIQTLDTKEIDDLYSEGIIKYPSKNYLNHNETVNKNETNEQTDASSRNITNSPLDRGDVQIIVKNIQNNKTDAKSSKLSSKEETDFVKLNKERTVTSNKTATQINNSNNTAPTNYRLGIVPKYIKNRKETQEKAQKAKAEEIDSKCPNGHVPLPDSERKETLRILRKNYQDYVNELNMLPIKVDTLRAQQRKIEIEKQLNKLEEGIKVFSRPKVYVKMNT
ncbi:Enkurin domain-containing protein 1 [Anthophora quadrimaculata]